MLMIQLLLLLTDDDVDNDDNIDAALVRTILELGQFSFVFTISFSITFFSPIPICSLLPTIAFIFELEQR